MGDPDSDVRAMLRLNKLGSWLLVLLTIATQIFLLEYDVEYRFVALAVDILGAIVLFCAGAVFLTEPMKLIYPYLTSLGVILLLVMFHSFYPFIIFMVFQVN